MNAATRLLTRLASGFRYTFTGKWLSPDREPTRAGVLNTGELIVLLPTGGTLVLSAPDTDMLADVLVNARAIDLKAVPIGVGGAD